MAFAPRPLTGPQLAALAAQVGERYEVYGLLVLFMAYSGLRAARGARVRGPRPRADGWRRRQHKGFNPLAAHQDTPTPRMNYRHPEEQDQQAHRAITALARACIPT